MTDQEIIQGLINRNERITQDFFFRRCQPLIFALISKFYPQGADYDELVNELYLHLMENEARRLRQWEGRSSIYQWLKMVARNFFLDKINRERVIETETDKRLLNKANDYATADNSANEAVMDVAAILDLIENDNYRLVLQKHVIEGMSFDDLEKVTGIKKANLYNIKKRALNAMEKIARIARSRGDVLCAIRCEEFILHCFGIHKALPELRDLALDKGWLTDDGAYVQDLGNTAAHFGLKVEILEDATLQDIIKAIDEGKQVIAAVDGGELIGDPLEERIEDVFVGKIVDHCVVVLSASVQNDEVALYDPAFGPIPLTVSIAHFLDAWEDSNYHCVLVSN
ncbi:MAG: sigma-70 family RNA polymerase sigma factor [Bacteroidales bacterium]|nr:sigma-70 family RNA polymerase sigma factor [Bacteroidales bacterium]